MIWRPPVLTALAMAFAVATYSILFAPRGTVQFFAGREMFLETLGALAFLVSSALLFLAFRRLGAGGGAVRWRRACYLLLGLFFFVAAGEELSWGQHMLGFGTPQALKELNAQEEVNLHNLWLVDSYDPTSGDKKRGWRAFINSNRLFDYFMATLFWLLPLAAARLDAVRRLLAAYGAPLVSPWLGLALALNVLLTAVTELLLVDGMFLHLAVSEIRECNYALLCALAAATLYRQARGEPSDGRPRSRKS